MYNRCADCFSASQSAQTRHSLFSAEGSAKTSHSLLLRWSGRRGSRSFPVGRSARTKQPTVGADEAVSAFPLSDQRSRGSLCFPLRAGAKRSPTSSIRRGTLFRLKSIGFSFAVTSRHFRGV